MNMRKQYGIPIILLLGITILLGCIAGNTTLSLQEPPMLPTPDDDEISLGAVQNESDFVSSEWRFLGSRSAFSTGFPDYMAMPNYLYSNFAVIGNRTLLRNPFGILYALDTEYGTVYWSKDDIQWDRERADLSTSTDMVFIRSFDEVIALDLESGEEMWNYPLNASRLTITPENNDILFVETYNEPHYMYALDASTGKEIWKYFIGEQDIHTMSLVYNGTIFFQTRYSNLYALDSSTGREKWNYQAGVYLFSSPKLIQSVNGEKKWITQVSNSLISPILAQNNTIFFHCRDGFMYALNIETGEEIWKFQAEEMETIFVYPVLSHEMMFYDTGNYQVIAVHITNGSPVWRYNMERGHNVVRTPVMSDDTIYFGDSEGYLYALNCFTGEEKWAIRVDFWRVGVPIVSRGKIFIEGMDNVNLIKLDAKDGTIQGRYHVNSAISTPVMYEERIVFTNREGYLFSLDISEG